MICLNGINGHLQPKWVSHFQMILLLPDDDRVKLEEQMIRLITRLLFVWFIKQNIWYQMNYLKRTNYQKY